MGKKPNIVYILNDHQAYYGHGMLQGGPRPIRPCFEAFAAQGMEFTNAYCVTPMCGPARRTMLTGLYPHTHGQYHNENDPPYRHEVYLDTLAEAGYENFYYGKWHAGPGCAYDHHCTGLSQSGYGNPYNTPEYAQYCRERGLPRAQHLVERALLPDSYENSHFFPKLREGALYQCEDYWCGEHATGITTMEDLVAQKYPVKLVIKTNGTFGELAAEKVFEALGVTLEDVASWGGVVEKTGGDAIKSGLQDDLYDMTIDHIGAGQANTSELCLTHDMYDVQLGEETMAKMVEMGYDYVTVEANTWNGQTEEIKTVGSQQVILVPTSLDYAVAYHMAKAVCENKADLASAVAAMSYFDPETAGTLTLTGVPLHPGAAAYYEDAGYPHG